MNQQCQKEYMLLWNHLSPSECIWIFSCKRFELLQELWIRTIQQSWRVRLQEKNVYLKTICTFLVDRVHSYYEKQKKEMQDYVWNTTIRLVREIKRKNETSFIRWCIYSSKNEIIRKELGNSFIWDQLKNQLETESWSKVHQILIHWDLIELLQDQWPDPFASYISQSKDNSALQWTVPKEINDLPEFFIQDLIHWIHTRHYVL